MRSSKILFLVFSSALLIPFQCVMLHLVDVMSKLHLMNRPGLVFMYVGFGCSMSIVLFHGFIKNVPAELEEAATIDGCNMFPDVLFDRSAAAERNYGNSSCNQCNVDMERFPAPVPCDQ